MITDWLTAISAAKHIDQHSDNFGNEEIYEIDFKKNHVILRNDFRKEAGVLRKDIFLRFLIAYPHQSYEPAKKRVKNNKWILYYPHHRVMM